MPMIRREQATNMSNARVINLHRRIYIGLGILLVQRGSPIYVNSSTCLIYKIYTSKYITITLFWQYEASSQLHAQALAHAQHRVTASRCRWWYHRSMSMDACALARPYTTADHRN